MADNKIMNFDQFSKKEPLENPKTALTGNNVDPGKKEKFVDQVKRADLSSNVKSTDSDYSKVDEASQDEIINLQSVVTAAERELNSFKEKFYSDLAAKEQDLQTKREALNQAIANAATTQTTTAMPVGQPQPTPTAQQSVGGVTPGQAPAAPTTA